MAYGWIAHYGYYQSGTSQMPNLEGKHFSDLTFTDVDKYFIVPESKVQPVPQNTSSYVDQDVALGRRNTLTEYYNATFIPNSSSIDAQYVNKYQLAEQNLLDLFPKAVTQCPHLINRILTTLGPTQETNRYISFVALKGRHRVITSQGNIYSFTDDDDTLHLLYPTGSYTAFQMSATINITSLDASFSVTGRYLPTTDNMSGLNPNSFYAFAFSSRSDYKYWIWRGSTSTALSGSAALLNALGISTGDYDVHTDPDNPNTDPYTPSFPPAPGPNNPGQPSRPGGGGGTFIIPPSDPTPLPTGGDIPNPSALGLYHIYNPSAGEMATLGMELYGLGTSAINEMQKLVTSPMEAILSVHCLPFSPATSGASAIQIGHYTATATAATVLHDHEIIDCGTMTIEEIWGSYLDFKMQIKLFLPFVGFVPLDPDDVVGATIQVMYIVDNATGAFCAFVIRADDGVVLGTFGGSCSYQIPLTATNYTELLHAITSLTGTALGAGASLASGGMAAPIAAGLASSALNVATSKKHYDTAGGLGTNTGFLGVRVPYLKIMVPNACIPANQNKYKGYPSYQTKRIGDLSGYTEIDAVHLEMIPATPAELEEIRRRLSEGVIL